MNTFIYLGKPLKDDKASALEPSLKYGVGGASDSPPTPAPSAPIHDPELPHQQKLPRQEVETATTAAPAPKARQIARWGGAAGAESMSFSSLPLAIIRERPVP